MRKVLFVGDAACQSGFARCTHAAAWAFHNTEWEVHVLGINYMGEPHFYPYNIYPAYNPHEGGEDRWGLGRLKVLNDKIKPDLVVLLTDPWNVKGYMNMLGQSKHEPKTVGWLAVDAKNQRGFECTDLDHIVTWTEFGRTELLVSGAPGDPAVIPLGYDHNTFFKSDKASAREEMFPMIDEDDFLVGYVGRNQTRKRLDLTIEYFADWVNRFRIDNAKLYLHVAPTGDNSFGLADLIIYHGMRGKVLIMNSEIGDGMNDIQMRQMYNSLDLFFTTTQGEGWGLPEMEAMACGVPVLAPAWSGLGDWAKDAACLVACDGTVASAPEGQGAYTLGGLMGKAKTIEMLNGLYIDKEWRDRQAERGFYFVQDPKFHWENIGQAFFDEVTRKCQL